MRSTIGVPLVVLVALTWAAAFVSGIVTHNYTPLGLATPVMLVVTGAVFAMRNGNGEKKP